MTIINIATQVTRDTTRVTQGDTIRCRQSRGVGDGANLAVW